VSHYKKIRASFRGKWLSPATRSLLLKLRKEEIELERRFGAELQIAKKEGRCTAFVLPTEGRSTPYKTTPATEGHLCGAAAFKRGFCTKHFFSHVLYLRDRQSGRAGRGVTRRPFSASEIPCGRMSEKQFDLMNDLVRLPMATPRDECIERLHNEDASNPIQALETRV